MLYLVDTHMKMNTYKHLGNRKREVELLEDVVKKSRDKDIVGNLNRQERNTICKDIITPPDYVGRIDCCIVTCKSWDGGCSIRSTCHIKFLL